MFWGYAVSAVEERAPGEVSRGRERPCSSENESVHQARLSLRSGSEGSCFLCHLQSKFQVLIKQLASETVRKAERGWLYLRNGLTETGSPRLLALHPSRRDPVSHEAAA